MAVVLMLQFVVTDALIVAIIVTGSVWEVFHAAMDVILASAAIYYPAAMVVIVSKCVVV